MSRYLLRRLAASLLLVWVVVSLTFVLVHAAPGSPVRVLGGQAGGAAEQERRLERIYGLDRPLHEQYLDWLASVARGDWGASLATGRPVARMIGEALPNTLLLAVAATCVEYAVALPLGIWAARRQGKPADHLIRAGSLLLYSVPIFWLGLMAILVFAFLWPVLPPGHMTSPGAGAASLPARLLDVGLHLLLPALVMGVVLAGSTLRFVRNGLLDVLGQDYIRTARAKGLSEGRVVRVHALRNALVPIVQLLGLTLPTLLNGVVVAEVVFSWPGVGRVMIQALNSRDYPVILATTTLAAVLVIAGNLAADLAHAAVDPRLRRRTA